METHNDAYGKFVREYKGKGNCVTNPSQAFPCSFDASQISDGKIVIRCQFGIEALSLFQAFRQENVINRIEGDIADKGEIITEGPIWLTKIAIDGQSITAKFLASKLTFKDKKDGETRLIHFGVTNFEYLGNKIKDDGRGGGSLSILEILLPDANIEIHQIEGYDSNIKTIQAQKDIDLTCEARIQIFNNAIEKARKTIDTIVKLLSFARGTKINWIYYDCYSESGQLTQSVHANNVNWHYSHQPVIDPRNPDDTAHFIQQSYLNYLNNSETWGLDIGIESYLDAKRETTYLETRALRAAILLEFFKNRYLITSNEGNILPEKVFDKKRKVIQSDLERTFIDMSSVDGNEMKEIIGKIPELNRKAFKSILCSMFSRIGLTVDEEEIRKIIKIRNSLVHTGKFAEIPDFAPVQQYYFLINVLDKIILKIVSYRGPILDIAQNYLKVDF
jgi:hypothetical protein